jgi:predicted transcriptional regulator
MNHLEISAIVKIACSQLDAYAKTVFEDLKAKIDENNQNNENLQELSHNELSHNSHHNSLLQLQGEYSKILDKFNNETINIIEEELKPLLKALCSRYMAKFEVGISEITNAALLSISNIKMEVLSKTSNGKIHSD